MFGKNDISKKVTVTEKELASFSQDDLYLIFTAKYWSKLTEESRQAAFQEVENRRAKADGRTPIKIMKGDKESFKDPGALGAYDPVGHVIYLNYRYFEGKSPMHTSAGALTTILHEGRHAYQDHLASQGVVSKSPDILKEWLTSMTDYIPPEIDMLVYCIQSIEDDARRFARKEMQNIINNLLLRGVNDTAFINEYKALLQQEARIFMAIQENLTIKDLDEIEAMMIKDMQDIYPDLDLKDLDLFTNARLVLNTKIESFDDLVRLLAETDKIADSKLSKIQNQNPDHIKPMKKMR